jgi:LPPG:FO 2-phospho-L-lactate transferase
MRPQTRLNGASQAGLGPGGRERPHRGRAGRLRRGPLLFTLGDLDFATHILRTQLLAEGRPLSEVTSILCARWQPGVTLLPMSDDKIEIRVKIKSHPEPIVASLDSEGDFIHFQEWWVRLQASVPAE